jgi:hypothetical protein
MKGGVLTSTAAFTTLSGIMGCEEGLEAFLFRPRNCQ